MTPFLLETLFPPLLGTLRHFQTSSRVRTPQRKQKQGYKQSEKDLLCMEKVWRVEVNKFDIYEICLRVVLTSHDLPTFSCQNVVFSLQFCSYIDLNRHVENTTY